MQSEDAEHAHHAINLNGYIKINELHELRMAADADGGDDDDDEAVAYAGKDKCDDGDDDNDDGDDVRKGN